MSRPHEISGIAGPPLRIVSSGLSTYIAHFAKTILFIAAFLLPKPVFAVHDMVCIDGRSASAAVEAATAGMCFAFQPEAAHGLGLAQVVRAVGESPPRLAPTRISRSLSHTAVDHLDDRLHGGAQPGFPWYRIRLTNRLETDREFLRIQWFRDSNCYPLSRMIATPAKMLTETSNLCRFDYETRVCSFISRVFRYPLTYQQTSSSQDDTVATWTIIPEIA